MSDDHLIRHVMKVCEAHAAAAPARTAGRVFGRPHADLTDDAEDALAVVVSGDGFGRPLPTRASETKGIQQGGRAASIACHDQLIRRDRRGIRSLARLGRGQRRHRKHGSHQATERPPEHRFQRDGHLKVSRQCVRRKAGPAIRW